METGLPSGASRDDETVNLLGVTLDPDSLEEPTPCECGGFRELIEVEYTPLVYVYGCSACGEETRVEEEL